MSEQVRRYIYSLGTPVGALLVFYGLLTEQEVSLWMSLVGAVLLVGEGALAAFHTPAKASDTSGELGWGWQDDAIVLWGDDGEVLVDGGVSRGCGWQGHPTCIRCGPQRAPLPPFLFAGQRDSLTTQKRVLLC